MHERRPRITVVGDLILDRYLIGDATKLNPEQPGVVIRVDREDERLGGAAAVASIATSLGAVVTLAGVVGHDGYGDRLLAMLDEQDIRPQLWRDDRVTTWKQRVVARNQIRPDRCDREVATPIDDDAANFLAELPLSDVLLISDYDKGVCTQRLLARLVERATQEEVPILVDPARGRSWSEYGRVTLIKANCAEAAEELGREGEPLEMARTLASRYDCHVVVTLGERGLVCAERDGETWHVPAVPAEVRDVCGAGDAVMAALGVALADSCCLPHVCRIAGHLAARQVESIGAVASRSPFLNGRNGIRATKPNGGAKSPAPCTDTLLSHATTPADAHGSGLPVLDCCPTDRYLERHAVQPRVAR